VALLCHPPPHAELTKGRQLEQHVFRQPARNGRLYCSKPHEAEQSVARVDRSGAEQAAQISSDGSLFFARGAVTFLNPRSQRTAAMAGSAEPGATPTFPTGRGPHRGQQPRRRSAAATNAPQLASERSVWLL